MTTASTALYWASAAIAWAAFCGYSLAPSLRTRAGPEWLSLRGGSGAYGGLMLATLFLFRWPGFLAPRALNPDESQFIAGAMTLLRDPVFWRSVDGQTAGPLIYYALVPLGPLGLLDYAGARVIGGLMIFGTVWFSYRGLGAILGEANARLGILPAVCFFAFSVHTEFVHYTSEHAALLLLAMGFWGVARTMAAPDFRVTAATWWIAGVSLGAVPWAKLQAVPPAAVLLLGAGGWVLTRPGLARRQKLSALIALAAAVCLVPAAFAAMLSVTGTWESFVLSYFADNWHYLDQSFGTEPTTSSTLWTFLMTSRAFSVFAADAGAVILVGCWRRAGGQAARGWTSGLLVAFAVASVPFTLFTRRYPHYLLFLVMPLTLLAANAVATVGRRGAWTAVLTLMMLPQIALKFGRGNPFLVEVSTRGSAPSELAREILRYARGGDTLSVWGWRAELHVETGLPQGTSNSNAASQLTPSAHQDYFLRRYVEELSRNQPAVFVDAVGPSIHVVDFRDRERFAHEQFPELRDYVTEHYEMMAELDGARVYRRRDRGERDQARRSAPAQVEEDCSPTAGARNA